MLFHTRSNHAYTYDPSSNRILTKSNNCLGLPNSIFDMFDIDRNYDFSQIGIYTIEVTQQCNLRCKYCCYSGDYENRRVHNNIEISYKNLELCSELIANHTPKEFPIVYVSFYGGEALLCQDKIKWIISEIKDKCPERRFEFSISTNGLLLNEKVTEWICNTPDIYLTITIDGNKAIHDENRVTASGKGSFDTIFENLMCIREKHPDFYNSRVKFISTVKSITDIVALNDFWMRTELLRDNRPQHISSIIPNFKKGEAVLAETEKFSRVYDMCLSHLFERKADILTDELGNLIKAIKMRDYRPLSQCISTCLNTPNSCFISANGDLYVCERFCKQYKIGTLDTGFSRKLCGSINNKFVERKNKYCIHCWAYRLCRRCPIGLNFSERQFEQYCENEKMQLKLALRYFCEILELENSIEH